jgi:hypothetical protein
MHDINKSLVNTILTNKHPQTHPPNQESHQPTTTTKLNNVLLGNNCYIGSNSNPIVLHNTTGTTNPPPPNEPISGQEPEFNIDQLNIRHFDNDSQINNAFAAPDANGCKPYLFGFIPINIKYTPPPPQTTSTRPSWWRRSRPTSPTTATSPPRRNSPSPTVTRSTTH